MDRRIWTGVCATLIVLGFATGLMAQPDTVELDSVTRIGVFDHFVKKGGLITWAILIPMSMWMIALIVEHAMKIRRSRIIPADVIQRIRNLFSQKRFRDAVELTATDPSDLSFVIHSALGQASRGFSAMQRAAEEAIEQRNAKLLRKIEMLNTIGNVSPMIGLFGTVFGMIRAFQTLVESSGQPDPSKLADGISVALVTTFWGLLVGIPALTAFAVFRNRVDGFASECALAVDELLVVFRPTPARVAGGGSPSPSPSPSPAAAPKPAPAAQTEKPG